MAPVFSSGIFIPAVKRPLFLLAFEEILHSSYNIIPQFLMANRKNTYEVKFNFVSTNTNHKLLAQKSKMAKNFLKENLYILDDKGNAKNKKTATSTSVRPLQIIDLETEHKPKSLPHMRIVDLTQSEPEVIVLDDTINDLQETLKQLDVTFNSINNIDFINLDESSSCTSRKMKKPVSNSDIQILNVRTRARGQAFNSAPVSRSPFGSEIKTVGKEPSTERKFKFNRNKCHGNDFSVVIQNSATALKANKRKRNDRTPHRNIRAIRNAKSPVRKKQKLQDVGNILPVASPPQQPLSEGILKYYKNLEGALNRIDKNKKKKKKSSSPLISQQVRIKMKLERKNAAKQKLQAKRMANVPNHSLTNTKREISPKRRNRRRESRIRQAGETNIFNPNPYNVENEGLRSIIIDGSNIAIGHGRGAFSTRGVKICVDYFVRRGHKHVKVFFPQHRQKLFSDDLLAELRAKCDMVFTPSQSIAGRQVTSYDDRFIVQYAVESGGVIVSTDNYRDLLKENKKWQNTIEKRLLMFTWVDDVLMFPVDPLGRHGPTLDEYLRF